MKTVDQNLTPQAMAITGCIGSGKSKVAQWLGQEWALPVFDSDEEVRSLLTPGQRGWVRLREILGSVFFDADSRVNKLKLRQAIFADHTLRQTIEGTLHPLVLANLKEKTFQFTLPCLVEVPLLYEVSWQFYFSRTLVVYADTATCLKRVMARDGVTEAQASSALRSQLPIQEKIALADFAIDNSGAWEDTLHQLKTIKKIGIFSLGEKKLDTFCC